MLPGRFERGRIDLVDQLARHAIGLSLTLGILQLRSRLLHVLLRLLQLFAEPVTLSSAKLVRSASRSSDTAIDESAASGSSMSCSPSPSENLTGAGANACRLPAELEVGARPRGVGAGLVPPQRVDGGLDGEQVLVNGQA